MSLSPSQPPNPRRVAAGKRNRQKRKGLSPEGRERLRAGALARRLWEHATGPRTPEGKARSARNGQARAQSGPSVRAVHRTLAGLSRLAAEMAAARKACAEML
jgi:hypothetical protein